MSNTDELSEFQTINVQNIVFGELYRGNYNTFIPIGIVDQESNEDNEEIKPFLINTPPSLYSSGIKAIFDRENKYVTGYNCCINLYNFKNVSEDEKLFTSKLEEIVEYTRSYLHSIKDEAELDNEMIDNFRLVNWSTKPSSSTENQPEGDDTSTENTKYNPKLYVKLIVNNKSKKILTNFFNEESNEEVDPLTLVDKKGLLTSALKIENVVINKKRIIIEVKMIESLYSKLPTYQPRQQKDRKKKSILRPGVDMKPHSHKTEVVKPVSSTETKTNNTLSDGIRNQNSFKLLETDDDDDVTTHHVESSHVL
jgi:hypothetical protein